MVIGHQADRTAGRVDDRRSGHAAFDQPLVFDAELGVVARDRAIDPLAGERKNARGSSPRRRDHEGSAEPAVGVRKLDALAAHPGRIGDRQRLVVPDERLVGVGFAGELLFVWASENGDIGDRTNETEIVVLEQKAPAVNRGDLGLRGST